MLNFLKKLFGWSGKTLTKKEVQIFQKHISRASCLPTAQQIIEYDKIYHSILKALWYSGTFWEILKQNPKEIKNIQTIWDVHKLRNSLVHDLRDYDERMLKKQATSYKKVLRDFLTQLQQ